jgi:hypothetical protein
MTGIENQQREQESSAMEYNLNHSTIGHLPGSHLSICGVIICSFQSDIASGVSPRVRDVRINYTISHVTYDVKIHAIVMMDDFTRESSHEEARHFGRDVFIYTNVLRILMMRSCSLVRCTMSNS